MGKTNKNVVKKVHFYKSKNPHMFFLDQKGLLRDPTILLDFKAKTDPKGLLNPGKLSKLEARI